MWWAEADPGLGVWDTLYNPGSSAGTYGIKVHVNYHKP